MRTPILAVVLFGCGATPPPADPPTTQPASLPHAHAHPSPGSQPHGHGHAPHVHPTSQPHGHANVHGHHHSFKGAEEWARRFDAPDRDAWQKPDAVIAHLAPAKTARVVDVGSGTGYFAVRFAKAVPEGLVYGADTEPDMVAYLTKRAETAGLGNIRSVLATPTGVTLPEPVDLIFLCNTYHHIGARPDWIRRIGAQLKADGRIAIVDFKPEDDGPGPPKHMRLPIAAVQAEFEAAGFRLIEAKADLLPRQYVLTFAKGAK